MIDATAKALATVDSFRQFIIEHRDQVAALDIIYSQPYQKRHLTMAQLDDELAPYPDQVQQRYIVAEVERRLSVAVDLGATVAANLKRAERLRQSILKRAFEGSRWIRC